MSRRCAHGFSLLEAIVALVILCAALLGAASWVASDLRALGRIAALAPEEAALTHALDVLEGTDLGEHPAGSIAWRDCRIDWSATPLEPARRGGAGSRLRFTLQEVALTVSRDGRLIAAPRVRLVQYAPDPDAEPSR